MQQDIKLIFSAGPSASVVTVGYICVNLLDSIMFAQLDSVILLR